MAEPSPDAPLLCVDDVTLRFGAVVALSEVSLRVEPKQVHAVIGPNGAGKSTLFNAISGVFPLSAGRISLGQTQLSGRRPSQIAGAGVGRSFQNVSLSGDETVLESLLVGRHHLVRSNVVSTMFGLPYARREERRHRARVQDLAALFGIEADLDRPLRELSYGRQKLVDVARAVCMEPVILLLDEPAAGLNGSETAHMAQLIVSLRDSLDIAVLLIEHDMGMVMSISDHVTVLDFGRPIGGGTPAEVQSDPAVAAAYLGTDAAAEQLIEQAS
ncbi:ABC transporter ATP-binding protein [Okibacterium endophyticum]